MQKQYEAELSTREIINHVNGIFLTEQPDVYNIKDGHKYDIHDIVNIYFRVRVDVFKGFTEGQKNDIRSTQEKQRQEHAVRNNTIHNMMNCSRLLKH